MVDIAAHQRRAIRSVRRGAYLLANGRAETSRPIFIFAAQRSGTTMLLDRLRELPQVLCYGEKSIAFEKAYLKSHDYVCSLIDECRYPFVAFKPLTSSHDVATLLALRPSAKGIWVFRRAQDRANSAVAQFSSDNLEALQRINSGEKIKTWHAMGLSDNSREIIARFDLEEFDAYSAAGLMWLLRNRLYFEQGLENRNDVLLVAYEDLVEQPDRIFAGICKFLDVEFVERMSAGVHSRSIGKSRSRIREDLTALCDEAYDALYRQKELQWQKLEGNVDPS